ncbi:RHS repeat-associated core domain-containing protein [Pluralibacter gergoviae]|uniref:RHS repeat-associated core domain-containing protein n=2 Tax=Pluralibacter gergoviae TaxID=61647 RepID=UPI002E768309|nr:RHS repeat-associated core domain-containing protein [Pluralibacter gergoviae]
MGPHAARKRPRRLARPAEPAVPGQYLDRETGLHYNTLRYYDAWGGCYTQVDPIGLSGGLNLYSYAPNPLTWVDPLGLSNFFTPSIFNAPSGSTHTVYQQPIDWDLPVNTRNGVKTNLDLALEGKSPFVVKNGKYSQINLHHSKQNGLGSLFELSADTHQKYYGTNALHPHLPNPHPINPVNRDSFNTDRDSYWRQRGEGELHRRRLKTKCRG